VTFDIDANGIVNVSAKDLGTGKEQKITITASSGLNKDDIDKMVKDAQSHAEEDKKRREEIEVRNQADSLVYATEKVLKENRDKVSEADAKAVEDALKETRDAIEKGNTEEIKARMEALNTASHRLAEAMYKKASAADAQPGADSAGAQSTGPSGQSDVVDAEFEETDK